MKALLIRTDARHESSLIDIDDELEAFYKAIGCDCIDIVHRYIGGERFAIVCDDEGAPKKDPVPTAIYDASGRVALVGNILVLKDDERSPGDLRSLTGEEFIFLKSRIIRVSGHEVLAIDDVRRGVEI